MHVFLSLYIANKLGVVYRFIGNLDMFFFPGSNFYSFYTKPSHKADAENIKEII